MSPLDSLVAAVDPRPDAGLPERARLSQIDASLKGPGTLFVVSGLGWLGAGLFLSLIACIKLHAPYFLDQCEYITYGRIVPAALTALVYGWGNNAVFAVGMWIMARLCGTQVKHLGILYVAGGVWNTAVTWGVLWIFWAGPTSVAWLEMPRGVGPVLGLSYALIALWVILCFQYRRDEPVYVSQWYLLAAFFWFPWFYFVGQMMTLWVPARGTVQALADGWFAQNAYGMWFTTVALAAIYYLLPKVLGKPIRHYYLSAMGFVVLAMFASWTAARGLIFGPVPVWVQTVSIVASVALIVPIVVTAINFHLTAWQNRRDVCRSPTLLFVVFGALAFTLASVVGVVTALRGVHVVTQFTEFTVGYGVNALYAFFTMTMFGAIYFMLPRLLEREWPSTILIHMHFWLSALGLALLLGALYIGGWHQGLELNDAGFPFIEIVKKMQPVNEAVTLGVTLLLMGLGAFFLNVLLMVGSVVILLVLEVAGVIAGVSLGEGKP